MPDHVFAAAASGNAGVFEAATEEGFFTYGVDVNECPTDPEHIMENLIKRVDVAVVETVGGIIDGAITVNVHVYGLAEGGVGLTVLTADDPDCTECAILAHPDVIDQVSELQASAVSSSIAGTVSPGNWSSAVWAHRYSHLEPSAGKREGTVTAPRR